MERKRITVVIPSGKRLDLLKNCIGSILAKTEYPRLQILVVNTGYTGSEERELQDYMASVAKGALIRIPWTFFADVCNEAVFKHVDDETEYLLFLNDDIQLINDVITLMADFLDTHEKVGTVGCRLHLKSGLIQHAGIQVAEYEDGTFRVGHRGYATAEPLSFSEREPVFGNTGACMMVPLEIFENLGGFPQRYEYESEDIEFNLNCLTAGYTNWFLGYALAWHYESQSREENRQETKLLAEKEREEFLYPLFVDEHNREYAGLYYLQVSRRLEKQDWSLSNSMRIHTLHSADTPLIVDGSDPEVLKLQQKFDALTDLNSFDGKLNILFVCQPGGCGYVRAEVPCKYLNRLPHITAFPTAQLTPELLLWCNMIVWHMPMQPAFNSLRDMLARAGVPQIADSDDNCLRIDSLNPAKIEIIADEVREWMTVCGDVTVTRKALGEYYVQEINNDIEAFVLPNCIDFETVPDVTYSVDPPDGKTFRLGWAGGRSHYADLEIVVPALRNLKRIYGDRLEIHMMGWDGVLPDRFALPPVTHGIPTIHTPAVPADSFLAGLSRLNLQAGIIPLADTLFNRSGKSSLKLLQFGAVKIPCAVSDISTYTEILDPGQALVADTAESWEEQIRRLIEDRDLRVYISEQMHSLSREYDMAEHVEHWAAYYVRKAARKYEITVG